MCNELICCILGYVVVIVCDWKIMSRLKSVEMSSVHRRYTNARSALIALVSN